MLKIQNTLTKNKEEFKPITKNKVNMYVCGITVYDYCHIGHARMFVVFDMVRRYLLSQHYQVTFVRNITDIDDKIIKRAQENKEEYFHLTERFIKAMQEDELALNVLPPDYEPRATDYIAQMIGMIETLLAKDFAYIAANGDVYYKVSQFATYGKLSHQDLEKLRSGARVDVTEEKTDPLDFVLWKMAKPNEPSWDSPWGKGRPGWHIECSAMSTQLLGKHFDLHGGGLELQFPHHENEIAQSEAATGEKFVNTWLHMGHVQVDKEKMSKSLGNFFTVRDVLKEYDSEVIRYFLVASHYRSPINYSTENLASAEAALERFYLALRDLPEKQVLLQGEFYERFVAAMNDDFNTPEAMAVMFDLAREINRLKEENKKDQASELASQLKQLGAILGLLKYSPEQFLKGELDQNLHQEVEQLIVARNLARTNKNWKEADRIRDELIAKNIILEDSSQGTIWRKL